MTPSISAGRRYAALGLLGLVSVLNYVDRQAFSVVQDDIKAEFALSDTMLSLLAGPGFAVVFALSALPIARYADGSDRPRVIGLSLGLWSLATAACGLVGNAWQMLLARMTLAVGESGAGPAGFSLLTDIFPEEQRTRVIGFMQAASSTGLSLGVIVAGLLSARMEWRHVFLVLGLPGLALALVVWLLVAEPRRARDGISSAEKTPFVPLSEVFRIVADRPTLRWVALICVSVPITGFGLLMWGASFLLRVHDFEKADLQYLGYAILAGLVTGNLVAGWLGDKFGTHNLSFNARLAGWSLLAAFPFTLAFVFLPGAVGALISFVLLKFLMTLWIAPVTTMAFAIVPTGMRATVSALINLLIILSGIGFGTFLAGALSDAYSDAFGEQSIRYALATITVGLLVGAFGAFMAARTVGRDEAAQKETLPAIAG